MFNDLLSMVTELKKTNSSNTKQAILAKYPELQILLKYTYHPYYQYHLTSKHLKKYSQEYSPKPSRFSPDASGFIDLLTQLRSRAIKGNKSLEVTLDYLTMVQNTAGSGIVEILYQIIDKGLKGCRISAKSINKVYPGLVPSFDVALAKKYDDFKDKIYLSVDKWLCSRKLDGLRLLAIFDADGQVTLMSRTGKEYITLEGLSQELMSLDIRNMVLDGELVWMDGDSDNFSEIHQRIRMKDYQISLTNVRYHIFDILTGNEFQTKFSEVKLTDRLKRDAEISISTLEHVSILKQEHISSASDLTSRLQHATENLGWEGLIIRKDTVYEGKRTSDILKCKIFQEQEFVVQGIYTSEQELFYQGVLQTRMALAGVVVNYKGNKVRVGSKWTVDERVYYYEKPDKIIGKTITVSFKQETVDKKTGKPSLQFPTIKAIHGDARQY